MQAKKDFAQQIAVASGMEYRILKSTDADNHHYRILMYQRAVVGFTNACAGLAKDLDAPAGARACVVPLRATMHRLMIFKGFLANTMKIASFAYFRRRK